MLNRVLIIKHRIQAFEKHPAPKSIYPRPIFSEKVPKQIIRFKQIDIQILISCDFQRLILDGPFVKNRGLQKGLIVKKHPLYHTVLLAVLQQFCNTVARYHCQVIKWGNTDIYSLSELIVICIPLESSITKAAIRRPQSNA